MRAGDEWAVTEEGLRREAQSLGEVLERLKGRISPALIGGSGWEGVVERARGLPANLAAFPFGFELPLHERRPVADLGVTVVAGTRAAAFYEKRGQDEGPDPSAWGAARVLEAIGAGGSPLRDVVGRNMMLEYDVGSTAGGTHPEPGLFLRPAERPIVGDGAGERYRDMEVVLRAMVSAIGRDFRAAEQREVERIYGALEPDTRVESFGVFPSRERAIRLAVTGFRGTREVMAFLERAGWRGRPSIVDSTVSRFEERGAFVNLAVHFDVRPGGPGPALGLSFLAKDRRPKDPRYWVDRPRQWTAFIDGLREDRLAVPEKLAELAGWSTEPETLFSRSGTFVLLRGIHHFKLVLAGDRIDQVKGYVFLLMSSLPRAEASGDPSV